MQEFKSYVQSLTLHDQYKKYILDDNFMNDNPKYYQNYPSLFSNAFLITKEQLNLLDISGYLYYQATIFTDNLIDENDISKFPLITICQEESIKILTSIYGLANDFWMLWNKRRNEYLDAIVFEKSLSKKEVVTIKEYETLADIKSAFGKVAIDCLYSIDNSSEEIHQKLLLSHKYFSVAFQLNDDIQDFKEDLKKGQFNWAVQLLKQQNITNQDPDILVKYLYIRGISKNMYLLGIDYCNKALNSIENITVSKWEEVLNDTKKSFTTAIIEIDSYIEVLKAEIGDSNTVLLENNLKTSFLLAIQFVKSKQQNNGSWREYVNQGGISNMWATAFITSKISESEKLKLIFENEIPKALNFLNQNRIKKLWSYNSTWIEDADSTNFVLLSLLHNNIQIENQIIENWLLYQTKNGGFSTYSDNYCLMDALNDTNISNVNGWLSVHNCVSAVSFYYLAQQNRNENSFLRIKNYFDENLKNELNAYWWTSSIYTYYYLAKTYLFLDELKKVDYILSKINAVQNENGSLKEVTISLPNLNRPWLYLAYLNNQEGKDTLITQKNFEKSLFLSPYDFLLHNYYGNYYMTQQNEKKGLQYFRTSLFSYSAIKSSNYAKNYSFSNVPVLVNSIIPNNLLHYITPDPQALTILKAFEKYHQKNDTKYKDFYSKKIKTYTHQLFKKEPEFP